MQEIEHVVVIDRTVMHVDKQMWVEVEELCVGHRGDFLVQQIVDFRDLLPQRIVVLSSRQDALQVDRKYVVLLFGYVS